MSPHDALVIVEKADHCIAFHDLAPGGAAKRIRLADYPHETVVDEARRLAFVGQYGVRTGTDPGRGGTSVFVVDIDARRLVNTLDCRPYARIHGLALDAGGRLYALSEAAGVMLVFDTPREDRLPSRGVATGGLKSHLLCVTRDGCTAFVTSLLTHTVTRLAPHDPTVAPVSVVPGAGPEGLCLGADESHLFVVNRGSQTVARIGCESLAVERAAPVLPDPARIYRIGADRLLVTHFNGSAVSLLDAGSLRELARLTLDGRPAAACLHPGGAIAHVSLDTNESVEIDLEAMRVLSRRPTGKEPDACFVVSGRGGS